MGRKVGSLVRFACAGCGVVHLVNGGNSEFRCPPCRNAWLLKPRGGRGREEAMMAVACAIRIGNLVHPSKLQCADCDGPAAEYDHRDYNRPLDVDPVCRGCNIRRGPAVPLAGSIKALLDGGRAPYTLKRSAFRMLDLMGLDTSALNGMPKRLTIDHWRHFWPMAGGTN